MPSKVTFGDGSTITYTYAADGTKLRTVHKSGSTTTTTDYCGNVIYENGVQKLLLTEEGYVTLADKKYHYYLKDHQGNNRVVVSQTGAVEETNHYYPFGGLFASTSSVQPYKYNGKELDTTKGLNLYDYGARMYDPTLGRFTTMDPMAEKYYSVSPYAYCGNNPVNRTDPTGADWIQDRYGSYLWDKNATNQETTRYGWNYVGTELPEGTDRYRILEEINGNLYHKNTSNPFASLVNWVTGKDILVEKKAYNPTGDHMMQQFAETGGEMVAGAVSGKIISTAGKTLFKPAKASEKVYTKSNLKLGREKHNAYHAGESGKEFVLPSKRRIDFLDIKNRTIYELKPYNPRAMKQGEKQLEMYKKELESMPRFQGWEWKTHLDTY